MIFHLGEGHGSSATVLNTVEQRILALGCIPGGLFVFYLFFFFCPRMQQTPAKLLLVSKEQVWSFIILPSSLGMASVMVELSNGGSFAWLRSWGPTDIRVAYPICPYGVSAKLPLSHSSSSFDASRCSFGEHITP